MDDIEIANALDCPQLFQGEFNKSQNNRNQRVASNFIQCMYYLCKNYNWKFYHFHKESQIESESSFLNFSQG